ncbi:MAG TPA: hypothetical protein DEQ05_06820, partial [Thermodesulfobacterium commune]|nr:hypothetical protein [Thermodesulfobacterium commune]
LKDPNKITFEPLTNTIIVKATPKILDEIEAIIKAIDKPRPQIMIEARIVEMRDEYAHKLGIKWGGAAWKRTEHSIWGIAPGHSITTNDTMTTKTPSINIPNTTIFDLGVANSIANLGVAL